ncbi:hypothetical protein TRAPUB_2045 [Trametes pubescens]|uniref:Uncharacterized protein n=1 Tax=Trametes pubescens TaxID=154538 RepID=A0A1M2VHQ6_TRAPU|nr:hypothetical protein TRAPUB_2045 [Trametes pubescens]
MYASSQRRGHHRKRLSALRLSSDSTVTTLPVYTSPPRHRHPDLPEIPSEQPPAYPDSAEEADEDTDPSDSDVFIPSLPPSLPASPRPTSRRPRLTRGHRRQQSLASASDPYLDSLLARSVHALEMSNALLQSSMSTQSSLSAMLADDPDVDRSIEQRTEALTSRMRNNRDMHESWMDDLDQISRGVEGLVRGEEEQEEDADNRAEANHARLEEPISQSLPTGGLSERMQRRQLRRASQDFRPEASSSSSSNLQLSTHDRSAFVARAPRALTMYIDSSEAADAIALPSTLGVRPAARPMLTPLPSQTSFTSVSTEAESPVADEQPRRVVDMLASFVMPRSSSSVSSSPSNTSLLRRRDSSSSSSRTVKKPRASKSPPPALQLDTPGAASSSNRRSRSLTPNHGSPVIRQSRPLTPPIEELSTSSTSSDSTSLHVERTVDSLRQILEKQRSAQRKGSTSSAPPPLPRPSLLSTPSVAPIAGTSTATASVSRLFTKNRHTTTRPPSPPRQSSMKGRSAPTTPITPLTPALHTPSASLLNVPDVFGQMLGVRPRSGTSSGASTPKRISFAEPPEPYSSSKPAGASSKFHKGKSKAKERGRMKGKGKAREGSGADSDGEKTGWWTGWLLGAAGAGAGSASGLGMGVGRARSEERYVYPGARGAGTGGSSWSLRPGFGNSLEEWGA